MNDRFSADDLPRRPGSAPQKSPWPVDLAHVRPFSIGKVEVRPATREVLSADGREVLEPLVMQVLVALASARGEILSRDDLIDACWGGRAVSDDAINRVISRLRALGRALDAFDVETITKVGYRLMEKSRDRSDLPYGHSAERRVPGGIGRRRLIAAAGAVATVAAGGLWLFNRPTNASSPEVERLIAQARAATREGMPDDMARAAALYRLATEKDPDSAQAWGGLAAIYRFQWEFSPPEEAPAMAARARSAAKRALEIDPDNGDAQAAVAGLTPMFGNWAQAEVELRRVLERHPQQVRIRVGRLLADTGRLRAALEVVGQAVRADPDVPRAQNFYARLLQDNGRIEESDQAFQAALERWPRHLLLWFSRFYFFAYTGRPQTALAFAAERNGRPIGVPDRVFDIALGSAKALATRTPTDVDAAVARHLAAVQEGAAYAENAVTFCSAVGRLDEAYQIIDSYFFGRGPAISDSRFGPETATYTPRYNRQCYFLFYGPSAPLRADPRFENLVREVGLEAYWRKTRVVPDYRRA